MIKKFLYNNKGSISLFVLIIMLFFSFYSVAIFYSLSSYEITQIKTQEKIKEIYKKDVENVEQIYLYLIDG